jgi:hypothetical protein
MVLGEDVGEHTIPIFFREKEFESVVKCPNFNNHNKFVRDYRLV